MKLWTDAGGTAPSPRRVRMYLAEKGLDVPLALVRIDDVEVRETRTPEFKRKNPFGNVPVLELDDGTVLAESMAIIRYLEELHPQPPLLGATPLERAEIEMWLRRLEQRLYIPVDWGPPLGRMVPGAEVPFREGALRFAKRLDARLAEREFVACNRFSMADIFAFGALDYGRRFAGFPLPEDAPHLRRWFEATATRPSTRA